MALRGIIGIVVATLVRLGTIEFGLQVIYFLLQTLKIAVHARVMILIQILILILILIQR